MNKILVIVKSCFMAVRLKFFGMGFYRKLLAYCCTIGSMKYDGNEGLEVEEWKPNAKCWAEELPSIYWLDKITEKMNAECKDINETFKLDVSSWSRDEVRFLMDKFEEVHNGFCQVNKRKLTLMESAAKLSTWVNMPFWQHFKEFIEMNQKLTYG